jgi:hypothetical protein
LRDTYKPIVKLTFLAFVLGAITCVPAIILPLWLDEILQLLGTRDLGISALLNYVAENAGGVPLGYLTQAATIHLVGYSVFAARLPSIVFGVLSYFGFGVLVLQAKLLWPSIGLLLFALLPLQIRYASEARPYEQALCLTTWCSVLFLEIVARPRAWKSVAYVLFVICAVYTQPFGLFVVVAHLSWSVLTWKSERMPQFGQPISNAGIAAIAGGLAFLPWFFFARNHWHQAISSAGTGTGMNLKTPLLIFLRDHWRGFSWRCINLYSRLHWIDSNRPVAKRTALLGFGAYHANATHRVSRRRLWVFLRHQATDLRTSRFGNAGCLWPGRVYGKARKGRGHRCNSAFPDILIL